MSSNYKPNFLTRTSKHIERKLFIEALHCLDYEVSNYHYIGFGAYYYVDFILFNKYLSINEMTCLEKEDDIENRMKFNKPFKFINFVHDDFSNHIATLRSDREYFVWADYNDKLNNRKLTDIQSIINTLKNGSIFIITVNADFKQEMPQLDFIEKEDMKKMEKKANEKFLEKNEKELNPFCGEIKSSDITPKGLPNLYARTIIQAINYGLSGRSHDEFFQLFNYVYNDNTRMLSIGGIIDKKDQKNKIYPKLKKLSFINKNVEPVIIKVPNLTLREKLYLDSKIQKNGKIPNIPFELTQEEKDNYIKYAKHYPTFYEVFTG